MSELTVKEYIDVQSTKPLAAVIGAHGVNADILTHLNDHLVATMHAIDAVFRNTDGEDPRVETVAEVEMAVKHFLTESYALRLEPDEDSDVLGGYPMPFVAINAEFDLDVIANTELSS